MPETSAPPAATRAERKLATRSELLIAARRLFGELGILATTTAQVAEAAGVSHGTVFVHFPTRDDLMTAVIDDFCGALARRVNERAEAGGTVREVLQTQLDAIARDEAFYARLVAEAPTLPYKARIDLMSIQSAVSFQLAGAAERDGAAGTIRPVPMHLLFNGWTGLLHYYLMNRDLFAPGDSVIRRCGDELIGYYTGLLAP